MFAYTKIMQGIQAVSAAVTDAYFNLTTLLLPGNGTNGAQNNTFLDSSSNNFTITRNGNTTQGTFSPFSQTGWSNYFGGSGDYLSVADNAAFTLGSGDFTVEAWVWTGVTATQKVISGQINAAGDVTSLSYQLDISSSDYPRIIVASSSTTYIATSSTTLPKNQWVHVAGVRDGGTTRIYVNGVQYGTQSVTGVTVNDSSANIGIGRHGQYAGLDWNGYISNFRLVKGTCLYPSGTTFTPSTTPLTAVTNTSLLTCQSNRFIDNSSNAFAITANGTPSVQAFSPFAPTSAYSAATNGGSGYFDGTGDYLTWSGSSVTTAFTFECWFYYTGTFSSIAAFCGPGTAVTNALNLYINNSTQLTYDQYGVAGTSFTVPTMSANQWYHVAFVRNSSNQATVFLNGVRSSTGAVSITTAFANIGAIGYVSSAVPRPWIGYLSGVKYSQSAVYDPTQTTITIPTAPPSSSGATLLLNFTNAGITDATSKNVLETVGNAQISTTQSKFGGSSMYFDGTGDWAIVPANAMFNLGTSDFTIEGWFYLTTTASAQYFLGTFAVSPNRGWFAYFDTTLKLAFTYSTTGSNAVDAGFGYTPSTNTWVHFAFVRSGADLKFYANGTQQGSTHNIGTSSIYANTQPLYIGERGSATGAAFNGYIDDLRITRYARYTANFTAPTAAFPLQ